MQSVHSSLIERRLNSKSDDIVVVSKILSRTDQLFLTDWASVVWTLAENAHRWCLLTLILWQTTCMIPKQVSNYFIHRLEEHLNRVDLHQGKRPMKIYTRPVRLVTIRKWRSRSRKRFRKIKMQTKYSHAHLHKKLWIKGSFKLLIRYLSGLTQIKTAISQLIKLTFLCYLLIFWKFSAHFSWRWRNSVKHWMVKNLSMP